MNFQKRADGPPGIPGEDTPAPPREQVTRPPVTDTSTGAKTIGDFAKRISQDKEDSSSLQNLLQKLIDSASVVNNADKLDLVTTTSSIVDRYVEDLEIMIKNMANWPDQSAALPSNDLYQITQGTKNFQDVESYQDFKAKALSIRDDVNKKLDTMKSWPEFHAVRQSPQQANQRTNQPTGGSALSAVKKMQEAILDFAKTIWTSDARNASKADPKTEVKPFIKFIEDKTHPVQQSQNKEKTLADLVRNMSNIGAPGNLHSADGIWMKRTNDALHQIYSVMLSLVMLSRALNIDVVGLQETSDEFNKQLVDSYTSINTQEKSTKANTITSLIQKMKDIFIKFRDQVDSNNDLGQKTEQLDKKDDKTKNEGKTEVQKEILNTQEKQFLNSHMNSVIPNINKQPIMLSQQTLILSDLASMDNFKKLLQRAGLSATDIQDINKIKNTLNYLNSTLGEQKMTPQQQYDTLGY